MMTNPPPILRVALPTPLRKVFDYIAPAGVDTAHLVKGVRVRVPFQQREMIGIVTEVTDQSSVPRHKLKQAFAILDATPVILPDVLDLCLWAADYYHYPYGEVIDGALPSLLRQGKPLQYHTENYYVADATASEASLQRAPQQAAAMQIFALHPEGLTPKQLQALGIKSTTVKALMEKSLICMQQKVFAEVTHKQGKEDSLTLNSEQAFALQKILAVQEEFNVILLDGITGSGKTEVYLQAMENVIARGLQVLVLVPEIGLTPQTLQRFRHRFAVPIVGLHSGLSEKERLNAFLSTKEGIAKIIIGTRSAVFSPVANIGLIIVDEEHDLSFKQQEGFRYHARDLAIMRAATHKIPIILGSATPSLETLCRADQGKYQHLRLLERAGEAKPPQFTVLDIRQKKLDEGLSPPLIQAVREHLERDEQVMLFLNRRGFAPVLMCHGCGWTQQCKRCETRMTFHYEPRRLHCHHCDARKPVPPQCAACGDKDLQIIGLGTERLEQVLQKHFPDVSIARIDRDSTQRKGSMENMLESIHRGDHRILIGTQMLAKGHHFPNVTLVGIVDVDGGFFSADFRALERMGQLILQVSGRAGRDAKAGRVIIQTRHPDHPLLNQLLREDYQLFARSLLQEREQALLPPYAYLALFKAEAHNAEVATAFLEQIKQAALNLGESLPIWGPVPAPMAKKAGKYRVQLLFQAKARPVLQKCLKRLLPEIDKLPSKKQVRWSLDVDPLELL